MSEESTKTRKHKVPPVLFSFSEVSRYFDVPLITAAKVCFIQKA
jgi:hypothetical protein